MAITITITIATMTIKRQKKEQDLVWPSPLATAAMSSTLDWLLERIRVLIRMIYMFINIVMITSVNHCGFNLVDHCLRSHLSERCLKLPSVGGNCLPFKGAFSLPGSKRLSNFSFVHSHFVFQWCLFFARPWEIFQIHSYSSNLSGFDNRPTWSRWW